MAVHQLQNGVGATLQRDMEVRHEGAALGTIVYEFIAQQVGFQRADAVAPNRLHSVERLHQVNEPFTSRLAEVTDVDTRQHNLLASLGSGLASLRHQRLNAGVTAETAGVGNGTVSAEIVAAVLHLQEETGTIATRTAGSKRPDVLCLHRVIGRG